MLEYTQRNESSKPRANMLLAGNQSIQREFIQVPLHNIYIQGGTIRLPAA